MARGIQILGYRNLDQAYAFLRDQRDEAKIYASDEGADQTEFCIQLADGHWRNPLPPLVDRAPYGEDMTDEEIDSDLEALELRLEDECNDEFDNELDVAANALLNDKPVIDESVELPLGDVLPTDSLPSAVGSHKTRTAEKGSRIDVADGQRRAKPQRSWKTHRTAPYARHSA